MDDLSIIDDLYNTFSHENDSEPYDKQIADMARNVEDKFRALDQLCLNESQYLQDLQTFQDVFVARVKLWFDQSNSQDALAKHKIPLTIKDAQALSQSVQSIVQLHQTFVKNLAERLQMWGPTQLITDIFASLYSQFVVYEAFMNNYANIVLTLDGLYKVPAFVKFLDIGGTHTSRLSHNVLSYVRLPLMRLDVYIQTLSQLVQASDPSHSDYVPLTQIAQKYRQFESAWHDRIQDCRAHLLVLEAFRAIQQCPVHVTLKRRLILYAPMIKVDLDDPSSMSDTRTYFLYNDCLIYCREHKEKKDNTKLHYKGTVELVSAEIRPLPQILAVKMTEVRRPLLFRSKKQDKQQHPSQAYGFEIISSDSVDAMFNQNHAAVTATPGTTVRRRHVIRTKTLAEQKLWMDSLRRVVQSLQSKKN
ncbi:epithelial cell transforming sequence 2 oncoprotein-like [Apophysomyces ossiformis]|uniref:Epithelial cell transforming sequence 2 oncoprotein-like n=1 Tax=Apophysomyces ossiformis TaxID=679940 RepID=A0A8H7BR80_9FUNG|nr:epithelial cell transforming sequence 2 oncoprotein-like [Apophysomyces ossiformis]